jgi:hypothetical protein
MKHTKLKIVPASASRGAPFFVKVIVAGGVDSGCPQGIRTELSTAVTMV